MIGSVYALGGALKGYLMGAITGGIMQMISGLPHMSLVFATGWALVSAANGYWLRSTRLRERRSGIGRDPVSSVYIADKVQVLNLRRS